MPDITSRKSSHQNYSLVASTLFSPLISGHQTKLQNVISRLRITVLRARGFGEKWSGRDRVPSSFGIKANALEKRRRFVCHIVVCFSTTNELVILPAMVSFLKQSCLATSISTRIIIVWTKVWDSHSCFPNCRQKIALHDLVILFYFCANRSPKPLAVSQWGTKHQGKIQQSHVF